MNNLEQCGKVAVAGEDDTTKEYVKDQALSAPVNKETNPVIAAICASFKQIDPRWVPVMRAIIEIQIALSTSTSNDLLKNILRCLIAQQNSSGGRRMLQDSTAVTDEINSTCDVAKLNYPPGEEVTIEADDMINACIERAESDADSDSTEVSVKIASVVGRKADSKFTAWVPACFDFPEDSTDIERTYYINNLATNSTMSTSTSVNNRASPINASFQIRNGSKVELTKSKCEGKTTKDYINLKIPFRLPDGCEVPSDLKEINKTNKNTLNCDFACGYYDEDEKVWVGDGCNQELTTIDLSTNVTTCYCNHLSTFAVSGTPVQRV
jgi:hypothetical protein